MEEVDKIIIDSLRNFNCNVEDDIISLKQFDPELVVQAIGSCLEAITPGVNVSKKLPPSMTSRLKIASTLAEQIKDLGFQGDMGYQTILYCNEVEVRRVLMFLIERLPREAHKSLPNEQIGYLPRLVKNIEDSIKNSLKRFWIPSSLVHYGSRKCSDGYVINSFGNSCTLHTKKLLTISDVEKVDENLKQYFVYNVPEVSKQCSPRKLLPSLLFRDIEFQYYPQLLQELKDSKPFVAEDIKTSTKIKENPAIILSKISFTPSNQNLEKNIELEDAAEKLANELEQIKLQYLTLTEAIQNKELKLLQTKTIKNEEQEMLEDTLTKIKLKTRTQAVLNHEDNKSKLKKIVQNASDHLVELANQWNAIHSPLLNEYRLLKDSLTTEESKIQMEKRKLNKIKEVLKTHSEDLKDKILLEQSLTQKWQQINKANNRFAYTRRILEIIGNISKQNDEIQKVLKDTKEVQKDINNLTGQIDRSFTLADELIFYDAKHDEMARSAYKMLATLRDECSRILKAVNDLGLAERESRNLQEQIETEKTKENSVKLERVQSDLVQILKETQLLKSGKDQ